MKAVVFVGAVNGDGRLPGSQFGMDTAAWYSTGAGGSGGAADHPAAPDDTFRVPVLTPYQTSQGELPMAGVGADDTAVPAQLYEGLSGLGPQQTADTGAGHGAPRGPGNPTSGVGLPGRAS